MIMVVAQKEAPRRAVKRKRDCLPFLVRPLWRFSAAFVLVTTLSAYSVLSHEAIIDSAWDSSLRPLLLERFPNATPDDLKEARAHAYGGCIIQDMGYYPFGSKFFTNLVHYVLSGQFIVNLLSEAQDMNEFAFALGALEHYTADRDGHSIGVNRSVPLEYPKLQAKFGDVVTYADDPTSHLRVEFGFDVLQVAHNRYAPESYHDFIGFKVAKPVLERAFRDTYGLDLKDVFSDLDLALGTYRRAVSTVIPEMTRVAWTMKRKELEKAQPGITRRKFVYRLSARSYRKEWDGHYREPGIGTRMLALFIRILPKVGIFKALAFKVPTPETEKLFEQSFLKASGSYRGLVAREHTSHLQLEDIDFDTGKPTRPGEYRIADDTYAELTIRLADKASIDPKLRESILTFYQDLDQPYATRHNRKTWEKTLAAVEKLRSAKITGSHGNQ